jgi:hypothetical protein
MGTPLAKPRTKQLCHRRRHNCRALIATLVTLVHLARKPL